MLQLNNSTPFEAGFCLFPNEDGIDTLYIMVKATFKIGQQWSLADKQIKVTAADEYWGEPEKSSIKKASDYHLAKKSTDIVMVGNAFSPNGQNVQQLDVSLKVGSQQKIVRVFGDRHWKKGLITQPLPFQSMPMVYERAYGGQHKHKGIIYNEPSNPIGLGFIGKRSIAELEGLPLPNLEDPNQLISSFNVKPTPACFAPSAPFWQPRVAYSGTYDEQWQTTRAPYLPFDFDKRFLNIAHQDLIASTYLTGGERVEISNMHNRGNLAFDLPHVGFNAEVEMAKEFYRTSFNLETLTLMPNDLSLSMLWRAELVCDKNMLKISTITIKSQR